MAINSKHKGKIGELEWSKYCREHGFNDVRRGQQYNGLEGEDCVGLDKIHQEVKRVEKLNLIEAMEQSVRDANSNIPIVAHRKNRKPWLVTMLADDWFKLYKSWINGGNN